MSNPAVGDAVRGTPSEQAPATPQDRADLRQEGLPGGDLPPPRLARTITLLTLLWYAAIAVLNVLWSGADSLQVLICIGCVGVVFAVQVVHVSARARRWSTRRRYLALSVQAILTYLPFLLFGLNWGSIAGPLSGSILLLLPGRVAWPLFGGVGASILVMALASGEGGVIVTYFVVSTMLGGLIIYGMARLSDLVAEVHASREEKARMAVAQERLRFARDLHDLLGYSLSAITLKSELIYRLVPTRPDRAREEISAVLHVSRQALADVRLVASGYRDMSLRVEAESAASILAAADIRAEVDICCAHLHPVVETTLATALREGITNILRHSKVQTCAITAVAEGETVRLTLVNDGVVEHRPASPHSGSGLGNLRSRLTAIGGRVESGIRDDGRFQLLAEAPLRPNTGPALPDGPAAVPVA